MDIYYEIFVNLFFEAVLSWHYDTTLDVIIARV